MRPAAWAAICSVLPLLTGCITWNALRAVNEPTTHTLYDRVDHIEKVVLKEDTLLMFLDGRLTNSPARTEFTLTVPLPHMQTVPLTHMENYQAIRGFPEYSTLKVSRDAIHAGWKPEILPVDNYITIPVGSPIQQDAYPDDYPWERPVAYAKSARLLPNTTQTVYPLSQYNASGSLAMEFIYIDASARQAYTVIYVDQVRVTKTTHRGYYCLLPLTVPADIATSPLQLLGYVYLFAFVRHM